VNNKQQPVTGANPSIASYNASAVKFFNATSSQVRFENKTDSFAMKNAVAVDSKVVGLAPGTKWGIRRAKYLVIIVISV
jgi:hypothetical protein